MAKSKINRKNDISPVDAPNLTTVSAEEQKMLLEKVAHLLRPVRREFKGSLLREFRWRQHFISSAERDRLKRSSGRKKAAKANRRNRLEILDTDPFYRILGITSHNDKRVNHTGFKPPVPMPTKIVDDLDLAFAAADCEIPVGVIPNRVVSVFVVAKIISSPAKFIIQKIAKKANKGFPGGTIEPNESILDAADREFFEESCDRDGNGGISIKRYAPTTIGDFELNMAQAGERGAVVYVELPAEERHNLRVGGGQDTKEERVERIYLPTFEQMEYLAANQELLPNSMMVWYIYKKFSRLI